MKSTSWISSLKQQKPRKQEERLESCLVSKVLPTQAVVPSAHIKARPDTCLQSQWSGGRNLPRHRCVYMYAPTRKVENKIGLKLVEENDF